MSSLLGRWRRAAAGTHLAVSLAGGALSVAAAAPLLGWVTAGLLAWVVMAAVFLVGTWLSVRRLDAAETAWLAAREDGSRPLRDLTLLAISVSTLLTVALVIFRVHQTPPERTALAVASVAASWLVVNTVYTLRYARLYYTDPPGGVEFAGRDAATYREFASCLHHRDDVPGVRHVPADDRHPDDCAAARADVLRLRRGDHRGHRQHRRRPQHVTRLLH